MRGFSFLVFVFAISLSANGEDLGDTTFHLPSQPGVAVGFENGTPRFRVEVVVDPMPVIEGDRRDIAWRPSYIEVMKSPQVTESIHLSEEQARHVVSLCEELHKEVVREIEIANLNPLLTTSNAFELGQTLADDVRGRCSETDKKIYDSLLPDQQYVLRLETARLRVANIGLDAYLEGGYLAADLGLSDARAASLAVSIGRRKEQVEGEFSRLLDSANEKLISELRPGQQRVLRELIGEAR